MELAPPKHPCQISSVNTWLSAGQSKPEGAQCIDQKITSKSDTIKALESIRYYVHEIIAEYFHHQKTEKSSYKLKTRVHRCSGCRMQSWRNTLEYWKLERRDKELGGYLGTEVLGGKTWQLSVRSTWSIQRVLGHPGLTSETIPQKMKILKCCMLRIMETVIYHEWFDRAIKGQACQQGIWKTNVNR